MYLWVRWEVNRGFWWGNMKVRGPPGKPRRRSEDNIKNILKKLVGMAWTGLIWLRTGKSGGILRTE
jgi:hypothetical protein